MESSIINWEVLKQAELKNNPYPYMMVNSFLRESYRQKLNRDFPKVRFRGSIPLSELQYGVTFQKLIDELKGDEFRKFIENALAMDLQNRPVMITLRGQTNKKDGKIHTDSKSKLVTVLLYLNDEWPHAEGRLRILNNDHDLNNYVDEVPPTWGSCLIFKVTDNCWHGHSVFIGERRAIQLNYVTTDEALNKHVNRHSFTARLKRLFSRDY